MSQYTVELLDRATPELVHALRRDFESVLCLNDSIWISGEPGQTQKILDYAAVANVQVRAIIHSYQREADEAKQVVTIVSEITIPEMVIIE